MNVDELIELLYFAEKMKDGLDPTTGIDFDGDTILKSTSVKRYNRKIAEILRDIIRSIDASRIYDYNNTGKGKIRKIGYTLSKEEKQSFTYESEHVSISKLVYYMNSCCEPYMKKIHATDITAYLEYHGYLETKTMMDGRNYKVATEKGKEIGIINEKRKNKYGNDYSVNMYNKNAQKFIVDNIEKILNSEKIDVNIKK